MKKLFIILAVAMCSTLAIAQTNQYFWAGGQFIMGNPINQIDSITFGKLEQTDSVLLYLPHTVKVVHDTVIQKIIVNDTIFMCHEHEYVDLGLSVKWANMNVGATAPEEFGDYFAWGETSPKETYTWENYKFCNGTDSTLIKYCNNAQFGYNGFTDSLWFLEPIDDAATVNWGGNWRMPTSDELGELINLCTWTKATIKGTEGCIVIGPNGKSIFIPTGYSSVYWSNSLYWTTQHSGILISGTTDRFTSAYGRANGYLVRPVYE